METFTSGLLEPLSFFFNPQKRVYWLYWVGAIVLAVCLLKKNHSGLTSRCRYVIVTLFSKRVWITASSRVDLQWLVTNQWLKTVLIIPLLGGHVSIAMAVFRGLQRTFGGGDFWQLSILPTHAMFTVAVFLVDDASRCLVHWAYHKIPLLWRFHAVHHSASRLTPLTLYRIHPVEMILNSLRGLWVTGVMSGLFMYAFAGSISTLSVAGVSLFIGAFNLFGANLRHSHVWVGFGPWEKWLVSPAQHQIHHSLHKEHWNTNYGSCLAVWDRMLGTWLPSEQQEVRAFGVEGVHTQSYVRQWLGLK